MPGFRPASSIKCASSTLLLPVFSYRLNCSTPSANPKRAISCPYSKGVICNFANSFELPTTQWGPVAGLGLPKPNVVVPYAVCYMCIVLDEVLRACKRPAGSHRGLVLQGVPNARVPAPWLIRTAKMLVASLAHTLNDLKNVAFPPDAM